MRLYRARTGQIPDHYEGAVEEHRQIVRALQKRDADLAEALMRQHVATPGNG
ncbi:FCD domain-containing protein [Bosea sp. (in: a-proteobacteria)]|uniref:FCD domain-containing protein n=1 Tax=Bosea sp. (in: a-proteobacteria) TaxID=1871050 RepID=UPI00345DF2D7